MEQTYIFNGEIQADFTTEYMTVLGIDEETQDGIIKQRDYELEQQKLSMIRDAKKRLSNTDWIVTKIIEVQITGGDEASLIQKYSKELAEREVARKTINSLE